MATKKPSVTTQLRQAKQEIAELTAKVESLTKELTSTKDSKDTFYRMKDEKEQELEAIHDFLDSMPNTIEREYMKDGAYYKTQRTVLARLVAWLVVKDTKSVVANYSETN